ncbi:glycerophosphodiester phosphodiesterase family protein [Solilutibacter silvestris]|uniref:Glycerophosphoryl diester phosphodiesterase n=1 Tax=Solilutibacter silvestris TaxID=1645665 RepID=A0A2K1PXA1_9GAMM|nr:glycerophosphodiester phosphodiesterase family protein [Lysobacter silvestris]PNS07413.1 Glycerophosphoryl diester phosphodiesterase [Lysobacter silvestris]
MSFYALLPRMSKSKVILIAVACLCAVTAVAHYATPEGLPPEVNQHPLGRSYVAAHRGGYFGLQNVQRQFDATTAAGTADILEMDLHASSDGDVFVFHDDDLSTKSTCRGAPDRLTSAQIRQCRLRAGDPLPRFEETLAHAKANGRIILDAEFKTLDVVAPAIALAIRADMLDRVYFQAQGDREKYAAARKISKDVFLQFKATSDDDIDWIIAQHDPKLVAVEMNATFATAARIARLHQAGKLVSVNSWRYQMLEERLTASCDQAFRRGVDIAVTNNPASCKEQRDLTPYSGPRQALRNFLMRPNDRGETD